MQLEENSIFIEWTCDCCRVSHVWVQGKCLLQDRQLQTIDLGECYDVAHKWAKLFEQHNPQNKSEASSPF